MGNANRQVPTPRTRNLPFRPIAETFKLTSDRSVPTTLTQEELNNMRLFAHYSGAAYCDSIYVDKEDFNIDCGRAEGKCPLEHDPEPEVIDIMYHAGQDAGTGYIARDAPNKMIIVAFQGTADGITSKMRDRAIDGLISNQFEADMKIIRRPSLDTCLTMYMPERKNKCEIHAGFWNSWAQMADFVEKALLQLRGEHPDYKYVFTGHSLGGAIAALGATHFRNQGWAIDLYTYGQPRLGSSDISMYITGQAPVFGKNYRVTNWDDVIPQLPTHKWPRRKWTHFAPEYWINSPTVDDYNVTLADITVIPDFLYSDKGNSQFHVLESIDRNKGKIHQHYFGEIAGCPRESK
ncbi:hypothetical protein BP6252_04548 [Coleophoma cylindrospora]|uniref:Fungal lipase-type domain-containing protein n=1 Tax=Coleophoma cylindrospora TaxID=1849047 RepID=A0A3D8S194_9HELO|nr:hypothetical protein BP6252_04548 [Coleophoma cylindrospora]